MLGKLLKHEVKATAKTFLLLYPVLLLISGFTKLFMELNNNNDVFSTPYILSSITYGFS